MARINGAYHKDKTPAVVAQWEKEAEAANSDEAAHVQLTYQLLIQVRDLKVLLVWVLVIVPIIAAVALFVLANSLDSSGTSEF